MVARAYGKAFSEEEIRDVYSAAWTATLSALRVRGKAMSDDELRSYILTAVASHASKEMRRRARKPTASLDETQGEIVADADQPLPEEIAISSETGSIARDLLSSLPPRRRAVMLLRYGWGLRPEEVCALVSGLSARAYRKEITRGVGELIERLELVESGEWCKSRQSMLRDFVAGTASEDDRRQVIEHLRHCRGCNELTSRLRSHLHELGAVAAVVATPDASSAIASLPDRIGAAWGGVRGAFAEKTEQAAAAVGSLASSGGVRGSGAVGAGVLAKIAGAGGAGKAALACVGVTAAAGACVATGVVPEIPVKGVLAELRRDAPPREQPADDTTPSVEGRRIAASSAVLLGRSAQAVPTLPPQPSEDPEEEPSSPPPPPTEPAEPVEPAAPVVPSPAQTEFDPVATAPAPAPTAPPAAAPAPSAPDSSPSTGGGSVAAEEFGP